MLYLDSGSWLPRQHFDNDVFLYQPARRLVYMNECRRKFSLEKKKELNINFVITEKFWKRKVAHEHGVFPSTHRLRFFGQFFRIYMRNVSDTHILEYYKAF